MKKHEIHVYLPPDLAKLLAKKAKEERRSVTSQAVVIIEQALKGEKP